MACARWSTAQAINNSITQKLVEYALVDRPKRTMNRILIHASGVYPYGETALYVVVLSSVSGSVRIPARHDD